LVVADGTPDLVGRQPSILTGEPAGDESRVDGRAAELVEQDVRVLVGEQLVARLAEQMQRDLVCHSRRRHVDGLVLAEQCGGAALELEDGRVLALLLVSDDRLGDRGAHSRRRLGNGVGAEIDHARHSTSSRRARTRRYARPMDLELLEQTLTEAGEPAYRARQ